MLHINEYLLVSDHFENTGTGTDTGNAFFPLISYTIQELPSLLSFTNKSTTSQANLDHPHATLDRLFNAPTPQGLFACLACLACPSLNRSHDSFSIERLESIIIDRMVRKKR